MVDVVIGDIFESKVQTLVNTVNCVGVMGKGVALGFRKHFTDMYEDYLARCRAGQVKLGKPYLYRRIPPPWILNFPTKDHWRSVAKLGDIVRGLEYLIDHYKEWGIASLAVPPLGCGQGQLEWPVVGSTLYRYLSQLDIAVELYAPYGTPPTQLEIGFLSQIPELAVRRSGQERIKPEWIALVEILSRIESEPYHWPVGRTTFQKVAYFATEAGLDTGLAHSRGSFGPYAPDLKKAITQMVNNGLVTEERFGSMFHIKVGPTFEDARKVYHDVISKSEEVASKVTDLFLRMTTNQAEMAATVHYAAKSAASELGRKPSECDVLTHVMDWKQRRRPPLREQDIAITIRNLAVLGWVTVTASTDLPLPEEVLQEA
jgi:O-acetyl-ADP-ribose deacetylase (regulator of RNase III)/uncharacterized protein YwgA